MMVVMLVALVANLATGVGLGGDRVLVVVSKWGQQVVMGAAVALSGCARRAPAADRAAWLVLTAGWRPGRPAISTGRLPVRA